MSIDHEDDRIVTIRSYDAASQRSAVETNVLWVDPASESILDGGDEVALAAGRTTTSRSG